MKMAKVTKTFKAVMDGDVYPTEYLAGDDVTGEAEEIGKALGCVSSKAAKKAPENK